jgi:hypothetical protein
LPKVQNPDDLFLNRLLIILSKIWATPLWEIRQKIDSGDLLLCDIVEILNYEMAMSFNGEAVVQYLDLENYTKEQEKKKKIEDINSRLKKTTNKDERVKILQELKQYGNTNS